LGADNGELPGIRSHLGFLPSIMQNSLKYRHFSLDNTHKSVTLVVQSESVTLSVDYLISSAQTGTTCLGFSLGESCQHIRLTAIDVNPDDMM